MKSQLSNKALLLAPAEPRELSRDQGEAVGLVASALARLDGWIEAMDFKGWDPHDALNSPLLHWTGGQRLAGISVLQLMRRSPVNLRPLLGIPKGFNPKAMGLFLANYTRKHEATGQSKHLERARYFFNWLVNSSSQGKSGPCWGYNFDWPNRAFLAPAGTPTIVNTAFIGLAFLCADVLQASQAGAPEAANTHISYTEKGKEPWLAVRGSTVARGACEFILRDLHTLRPKAGELCFSYTPLDRRFVHNSNLLGAWLLAAVYAGTGEPHLAEAALAAARFTTRRQRADGSWAYGISPRDGWVDNFHTGYVLVALNRLGAYLDTKEFDASVQAGYEYWKTRMFGPAEVPKYYPDRDHPIDIHSISQAILTFIEFAGVDPEGLRRAERVARWAIRNMQDPKGYFHYQIRRWYRIRTPYMRWGQVWMQLALLTLVQRLSGHDGGRSFLLPR